jgi:uncharacterized membrane protein
MERAVDEHLVHRLEAFSDIVIALSLSEIAFNLQVPIKSGDVFAHPITLVGFLVGFVFIAAIWRLHNRIFADYFVPDTVGIVANFIMLAALVLFAWAQQLYYHYGLTEETVALYAGTGGVVYGLIGFLFVRGAYDTRLSLELATRTLGRQLGARAAIVGGFLLASLATLPLGVERVTYVWLAIVPVVLVTRFYQRRASSAIAS